MPPKVTPQRKNKVKQINKKAAAKKKKPTPKPKPKPSTSVKQGSKASGNKIKKVGKKFTNIGTGKKKK